ncbi:4-alpha-glucanotransferase [Actinomycetaceae bacterium TAE3-ERU4]|nr:4-alpha-glucanotransferase [Actinomycetaceae bacterium TAE3-ERU4]
MPQDICYEDLSALRQIADLYGVATHFWDYTGNYREVDAQTIISTLKALGLDFPTSPTPEDLEKIAHNAATQEWRNVLPPTTVIRAGHESRLAVHVPHGSRVWVHLDLEDGSRWELSQSDVYVEPMEIDGQLTGRATFALPANLPLGYHTVVSDHEDGSWHKAHLIVVPNEISPSAFHKGRAWGVAAQLYSVTSSWGWGIGDAADLADLATICAQRGADFLLVNPLHAAEAVPPLSNSPYLPVTRRFVNPQYIRPEWVPEVASLSPRQVKEIRALSRNSRKHLAEKETLINREESWELKQRALQMIFEAPRSIAREAEFVRFQEEGGQDLQDFGLWCALEEAGYSPQDNPELSVKSPQIQALREKLASRVEFYIWMQWIIGEQLAQAQRLARESNMRIGVIHDLAVGVHPHGSAVWSNPENFAPGIQVGAPPDMYNQHGQNWSQPPWSPTALEECGYEPLKQMLQAVLAHAGGVRIDHILGLFRLWWIPAGNSPANGTYVRYNHEAMVGILLLEAQRAEVVVIGEDLGTVEPWVRDYLTSRGILGTSVFWFEHGPDGKLLYPDAYRRNALATVNTHDLPPTLGYLRGIHTDLREELGLLAEDVKDVRAADAHELEQTRERLRELGLLDQGDNSERGMIAALHKYIARTPSLLTAVSLVDAVGEIRPQNQPGTHLEYPNWCVPLADEEGNKVTVSDLLKNEKFNWLMNIMNESVR